MGAGKAMDGRRASQFGRLVAQADQSGCRVGTLTGIKEAETYGLHANARSTKSNRASFLTGLSTNENSPASWHWKRILMQLFLRRSSARSAEVRGRAIRILPTVFARLMDSLF